MIYTVTFNPSLDYIVRLSKFEQGAVNRTTSEQLLSGGKGINVSIVLNNLGFENTALGFIAGFTGEEIDKELQKKGCKTDFIKVKDGYSRINVKIKAEDESEINGQGPIIAQKEIDSLYQKLSDLKDGDILVLAGSIPTTLPETIYMDIMKSLENKNIRIIVDATGKLLKNVLAYHPFLVKPNKIELGEIFGVSIQTNEEVVQYAKKLKEMGALNVLISMAGEGAILVSETGEVYESKPPVGKLVNSVGAGDSMVAGFIAGYLEKQDYEYALKMGLSAGSASAFSENLATKEEVLKNLQTL